MNHTLTQGREKNLTNAKHTPTLNSQQINFCFFPPTRQGHNAVPGLHYFCDFGFSSFTTRYIMPTNEGEILMGVQD